MFRPTCQPRPQAATHRLGGGGAPAVAGLEAIEPATDGWVRAEVIADPRRELEAAAEQDVREAELVHLVGGKPPSRFDEALDHERREVRIDVARAEEQPLGQAPHEEVERIASPEGDDNSLAVTMRKPRATTSPGWRASAWLRRSRGRPAAPTFTPVSPAIGVSRMAQFCRAPVVRIAVLSRAQAWHALRSTRPMKPSLFWGRALLLPLAALSFACGGSTFTTGRRRRSSGGGGSGSGSGSSGGQTMSSGGGSGSSSGGSSSGGSSGGCGAIAPTAAPHPRAHRMFRSPRPRVRSRAGVRVRFECHPELRLRLDLQRVVADHGAHRYEVLPDARKRLPGDVRGGPSGVRVR